jgi:signal transduction histidine kinase
MRTDRLRLRQILLNVAGNACKFTKDGSISVRVEAHDERMAFVITDTGIGIARDRLQTIFERFSQADSTITREFGGTGLGLAISKRLAALMGGDLRVESEVGEGSTFTLDLPRTLPEAPPTAAGSPRTARRSNVGGRPAA